MFRCARYAIPLLLCVTLSLDAGEQKWIELSTSLDPWKGRTEGWIFADSVALDAKNPRKLSAQAGKAILVNGPGRAPDLLGGLQIGAVQRGRIVVVALHTGAFAGDRRHRHALAGIEIGTAEA